MWDWSRKEPFHNPPNAPARAVCYTVIPFHGPPPQQMPRVSAATGICLVPLPVLMAQAQQPCTLSHGTPRLEGRVSVLPWDFFLREKPECLSWRCQWCYTQPTLKHGHCIPAGRDTPYCTPANLSLLSYGGSVSCFPSTGIL